MFPELINIVFITFYNFIVFIILFYAFIGIRFARYKEYIICLISFSKIPYELPAFNCAIGTGNFWSICLGVNTFSPFAYFTLYVALDTHGDHR